MSYVCAFDFLPSTVVGLELVFKVSWSVQDGIRHISSLCVCIGDRIRSRNVARTLKPSTRICVMTTRSLAGSLVRERTSTLANFFFHFF